MEGWLPDIVWLVFLFYMEISIFPLMSAERKSVLIIWDLHFILYKLIVIQDEEAIRR